MSRLATCISLWTYAQLIVKLCFITTWERSVPLEGESSSPILKIYFRIQWLALLRTITLVNHLVFRLLKSSEWNLTQWTFWLAIPQIALHNTNQCADACTHRCTGGRVARSVQLVVPKLLGFSEMPDKIPCYVSDIAVLPPESTWYLCTVLNYWDMLAPMTATLHFPRWLSKDLTRDLQADNYLLLFQGNILVMRIVLLYWPDITSIGSPCYDQTNEA